MANALDEFRAQREAADQLYARLKETSALLQSIQSDVARLVDHKALRELLSEQAVWLEHAARAVKDVRALRDDDIRRFWPAMWKRWAVATAFALASAFAFGSGYVWASRPYQAELESLRSRVQLLDSVAQRVLTMSPEEHRQFDALMKWKTAP